MWRRLKDGHSYVDGFGEDDLTVMLQYLCIVRSLWPMLLHTRLTTNIVFFVFYVGFFLLCILNTNKYSYIYKKTLPLTSAIQKQRVHIH